MKKVPQTQKKLSLSIILDKLTDLGWEYTCGTMTRSGMQTYDELMQYVGALEPNEHWNEDAYIDKQCDHQWTVNKVAHGEVYTSLCRV